MKNAVQNSLFRIYTARNEGEQILIMASMLSLTLQAVRIMYTGKLLFSFLVWNLVLAIIPYLISSTIGKGVQQKNSWLTWLMVFTWLVFVPNSFYIITDLFHLRMNEEVPLWYDLALLLSFAWTGLLFGIVSVRQMERVVENWFNKKFGLLFIIPVMFLNGLGVYVGRYLRFNTWDVIAKPLQLTSDIINLFIHPIRNRLDWSMIVCYTLLITVFYVTVKKMAKAF